MKNSGSLQQKVAQLNKEVKKLEEKLAQSEGQVRELKEDNRVKEDFLTQMKRPERDQLFGKSLSQMMQEQEEE